MSAVVEEILAAFDSLPAGEKDAAIEALMTRHFGAGDLPEAGGEELPDELFQTYDAAEAAVADAPMHGSVLFYNPYALEVSAALRCWPKKPLAEVVVEFMPECHPGDGVHSICADFARWLSRQSPATEMVNFTIVNLPGLPWAGKDFDYWAWYDRVMAEVAAWDPPPILVDLECFSVTHRGEVLWPPPDRRRERPADRRTRPPGAPFPLGWSGNNFKGFRECKNDPIFAFTGYPPEELPPIAVPLTGTFDWLRAGPPYEQSIAADPGETANALAKLVETVPVGLPAEFVEFFRSPGLWGRIRAGCYLHLDDAAGEIRGGLGWLVRFASDSQYSGHWCLYVSPCRTKHAVVTTDFYTGSDCHHPRGGPIAHPRDITTCAASFEEFVYRYWLERELSCALHGLGAMPVGGAEYLAFYAAKAGGV